MKNQSNVFLGDIRWVRVTLTLTTAGATRAAATAIAECLDAVIVSATSVRCVLDVGSCGVDAMTAAGFSRLVDDAKACGGASPQAAITKSRMRTAADFKYSPSIGP